MKQIILWCAALLFLLPAPACAEPYFEFYPRSIVVNHQMGATGKFVARITLTPRLTVKDGVAHVSVGLSRKEMERQDPRGLARVEWELDVADCDSDTCIHKIDVTLSEQTVTANSGKVELHGQGVVSITVHYQWLKNDRSISFDSGRLLGLDAANEKHTAAEMNITSLIATPDEAAGKLTEEFKALDAEAKELAAHSKEMNEAYGLSSAKMNQQISEIGELRAASRSAKTESERNKLEKQADKKEEQVKRLMAESHASLEKHRKIGEKHSEIVRELEALELDIKTIHEIGKNK